MCTNTDMYIKIGHRSGPSSQWGHNYPTVRIIEYNSHSGIIYPH